MGLFDSLLGRVLGGSPNAGPMQSVLGSILAGPQTQDSGLTGLVNRFEQAGLGQLVGSWIGTGQNQPVSPDQLQQVFGQDRISQWAQQSGLPVGALLSQLSQFLPHAVDHMTPNGQLPDPASFGSSAEPSPFDEAGIELPNSPGRAV